MSFFSGQKHLCLLIVVFLVAGCNIPVRADGTSKNNRFTEVITVAQATGFEGFLPQDQEQPGQLVPEPTGTQVAASQGKSSPKKPAKKKSSPQSTRKSAAKILDEASKLPWPENVIKLAGAGAVLVVDNHTGDKEPQELFSHNPDQPYVPASILKLVTSAAVLEAMGPDYRFVTDFYLAPPNDLWIVGRGDPFLVSEEICIIAGELLSLGLKRIENIRLDTTFFEPGLILDGTTYTNNAYDAFNTALAVNFNTVSYLIDRKGKIVEFDECTPLTPITVKLAEKNRPRKAPRQDKEFRINISSSPIEAEEQAGQLFLDIFKKFGIEVTGSVVIGGQLPSEATPLYRHANSINLEELLVLLLENSNNFIANQIFLTLGAELYGPPATMEKGQKAIFAYLDRHNLDLLNLVEGSGLSRLNSLTARQMGNILAAFEPSIHLVKSEQDGSVFYKTGTMSDISTLAGYLIRPERPQEPISFVILLNGNYYPGTREKILDVLKTRFIDQPVAGKS
jgi:D-alanyl-D-alanine carboxypeptidase/D-alanyl-D-alanine-endopeptidase (penicillin-binding protein 4)